MASSYQTGSQPPSLLDRLPDEILQMILQHAMTREFPLFLESSSSSSSSPSPSPGGIGVDVPDLRPPRPRHPPMTIHYRHSGLTTSLNGGSRDRDRDVYAPQAEHRADWLRVNATCRRLRRVGKEAFFAAKVVAVAQPGLPDMWRFGLAHDLLAEGDREVALRCVRHVVLVHERWWSTYALTQLKTLVTPFSRLETCTLFFDSVAASNATAVYPVLAQGMRSEKGKEQEGEQEKGKASGIFPMPPELRQALVRDGVPDRLELRVAFAPPYTWDYFEYYMIEFIYPFLQG
ncbi:hypothetical protein F4778DRAFT_717608 [Xylariomycetidae sp. FL2044]|nr:hypothetical protein F4778DRAFT_717608 [Xylariomycetidae sp. FL2044]